jgi:hypothetical protein
MSGGSYYVYLKVKITFNDSVFNELCKKQHFRVALKKKLVRVRRCTGSFENILNRSFQMEMFNTVSFHPMNQIRSDLKVIYIKHSTVS